MRSATVIWTAFLFYTTFSISQKNEAADVLLKKADEVLYDDPVQTLKIGEHLLRNPGTSKEKTQSYLLLAKGNLITGNYSKAIAHIQSALAEAKDTRDNTIQFDALLLASEIYALLDLFEISEQYAHQAAKMSEGENKLQKKLEAYRIFVADSSENIPVTNRLKKLSADDYADYSFITYGTPFELIGRKFQKTSQMDSAKVYFEKSIATTATSSYWRMIALVDYSDYYFDKKEYHQAIALLDRALENRKIRNPKILMTANQKLSDCYLALGNKTKFHEFKQESLAAAAVFDLQTTMATNFAFEVLQKEKAAKAAKAKSFHQKTHWILSMAALVILLGWLFARWLFATRINHTQDIINYLKLIKKSEEKQEIAVKPAVKNLSIPKETESQLFAKLEKFEAGKKYLSKEISLAQMAALFETNTKYLSEVINKYKGKNVNLYINELRIKYIVDKLKSDPRYLNYKVSYLAEECGFSSHSIFSAVFKNITGITPNIFIQFLTQDMLEVKKPQLV